MNWTGKMIAGKIVTEGTPVKVNPNGVDFGVSEIWKISPEATAVIHGKTRTVTPDKELVKLNGEFYDLKTGVYEVRVNCKVKIPQDAVGFCYPRSTLNRLGILSSNTAVWDSGYEGFGTITFYLPIREAKIHKDEAWVQFTVKDSHLAGEKYEGHWQGEKAGGLKPSKEA